MYYRQTCLQTSLSTRGCVSLCSSAGLGILCVCALQQQTHTGCYQNAKQQRTFCHYRLTLAEQQPVHFEVAQSLLFPDREPPHFHINHTSLVIPGKTCKSYQTSRICILLISHMLSHTQSLKSATTVSPPTLTSGLCYSSPCRTCPQGTSGPLTSFHPIPTSSVIHKNS